MKLSVRTTKPVTSGLPVELDSWDRAYKMALNMLADGDTAVDITILTNDDSTYAIVEVTSAGLNPIIVIRGTVTSGASLDEFLAAATVLA